MTLEQIIIYVAMAFWLFPPLRQYRRDYFSFFLVLALLDPIVYLLKWIPGLLGLKPVPPNVTYTFGTLAMVMTLVKRETIRKYYPAWIILFALLFFFSFIRIFDPRYIMLANLLSLVYLAMKVTINDYSRRQKLHFPHIVLLAYIVSLFTKILFYLLFRSTGYLYFYLTNLFELLVAVYFAFVALNDYTENTGKAAKIPEETIN